MLNLFFKCLLLQGGNLNLATNLENYCFYDMLIACKCTPLCKKLGYDTKNEPYLANYCFSFFFVSLFVFSSLIKPLKIWSSILILHYFQLNSIYIHPKLAYGLSWHQFKAIPIPRNKLKYGYNFNSTQLNWPFSHVKPISSSLLWSFGFKHNCSFILISIGTHFEP
jgi:hypothetical protein